MNVFLFHQSTRSFVLLSAGENVCMYIVWQQFDFYLSYTEGFLDGPQNGVEVHVNEASRKVPSPGTTGHTIIPSHAVVDEQHRAETGREQRTEFLFNELLILIERANRGRRSATRLLIVYEVNTNMNNSR